MLAYHNDPTTKQEVLEQLQGSSRNVSIEEYESRFGIPQVLAYLEDAIFKRLPNEEAKDWPIRFMSAINVGADLSAVWREFAFWLLVDPIDGVIQHTHPGSDTHRVIMQVATLYRDGYTQQQMRDAAADAAYASYAAEVAYDAVSAASYAAKAAANAASAVVYATFAADAAFAAVYAAFSYVYNASYDRYAAVRDAAYIKISNKLIELLEKQEVNHDHK